jgi:regulatory protein
MDTSPQKMTRKAPPLDPTDAHQAREKCLRLLTTRPRSRRELQQALRRRGFDQHVIAEVIAGLEQAGLINDEEFARAWVASRLASGAGRRKLHWELRQKGVPEPIIQDTLAHRADEGAELNQALALAQRRLRGEPDAKELARLQRLLLGRGYEFDTVNAVLRSLAIASDGETPQE